jgi:hypothetical protein
MPTIFPDLFPLTSGYCSAKDAVPFAGSRFQASRVTSL